jgi:hypothetical protein
VRKSENLAGFIITEINSLRDLGSDNFYSYTTGENIHKVTEDFI